MNSTTIGLLKTVLTFWCFVSALTCASRVASACAGEYQDVWHDSGTVYSTMTMTQQTPGDWISAFERLTSPDSRTASQDTGYQVTYQVTAVANLSLNFIDGTYSAYGYGTENYADQGDQSQPHLVNPFIEITAVGFSGDPMAHQNGSATLAVTATASKNCTGAATVSATMGYPANMAITISIGPPDGNGSQQSYTANGAHTFAGQDSHQFSYSLATAFNNQISAPGGGANVTAYIQATPPGCTAQNAPGVSLVKTFTVL